MIEEEDNELEGITEISRRSSFFEGDPTPCEGSSATSADAEIVVDVDGETIYLHGMWVDGAETVLFEATETSAYDWYDKFNKASPEERKAMNKALEDDDFIYLDWPAQIYYFELNKMLQKELKQHGRNPEECQVDPDYLF